MSATMELGKTAQPRGQDRRPDGVDDRARLEIAALRRCPFRAVLAQGVTGDGRPGEAKRWWRRVVLQVTRARRKFKAVAGGKPEQKECWWGRRLWRRDGDEHEEKEGILVRGLELRVGRVWARARAGRGQAGQSNCKYAVQRVLGEREGGGGGWQSAKEEGGEGGGGAQEKAKSRCCPPQRL